MNKFSWGIFYLIVVVLAGSCIPRKRIVVLKDKEYKWEYPKDSVINTYELQKKAYKLRPYDIIQVRVASLTPAEFDFIAQYEDQLGARRLLNMYSSPNASQGQQFGNQNLNQLGRVGNQQSGGAGANSLIRDNRNTGFQLDGRGILELPKIGEINLQGNTIEEAQNLIQTKLEDYFETPVVRLELLSFTFMMLGEVTEQGLHVTYKNQTNLLEAFSIAGNLEESADRSNVKIIREREGQYEVAYVDLTNENFLASPYFFLFPNDIIVVQPLPVRDFKEAIEFASDITATLGFITTLVTLIVLLQTNN